MKTFSIRGFDSANIRLSPNIAIIHARTWFNTKGGAQLYRVTLSDMFSIIYAQIPEDHYAGEQSLFKLE